MVPFREVLHRLDNRFGSEDFTKGQKASFDDDALVQQAKVNTLTQISESPDTDDAVKGAVADSQGAPQKTSDYFFTNDPGRTQLIADIAKWFREVVTGDKGRQQQLELRHAPDAAAVGIHHRELATP